MRFFEGMFSDPGNWESNPPQPAIEERIIDRPEPDVEPEETVEAEIAEPEGEPAKLGSAAAHQLVSEAWIRCSQ
jgi:hypothetical protein